MTMTQGTAAPGWYQDPSSTVHLRWWDGATWSEHVQIKAPPVVATHVDAPPPPGEHPIDEVSPRASSIESYGWDRESSHRDSGERVWLAQDTPPEPSEWIPDASAARTAAVWALAATPLVWTLGVLAAAAVERLAGALLWQRIAIAIVVVLIGAIMAHRDQRALWSRGYRDRTTPWLALLTPLPYLIVRTLRARRAGGRAVAPLIVHALLLVAFGGLAAAFALGLLDGALQTTLDVIFEGVAAGLRWAELI